jgi:hypothetical protein
LSERSIDVGCLAWLAEEEIDYGRYDVMVGMVERVINVNTGLVVAGTTIGAGVVTITAVAATAVVFIVRPFLDTLAIVGKTGALTLRFGRLTGRRGAGYSGSPYYRRGRHGSGSKCQSPNNALFN